MTIRTVYNIVGVVCNAKDLVAHVTSDEFERICEIEKIATFRTFVAADDNARSDLEEYYAICKNKHNKTYTEAMRFPVHEFQKGFEIYASEVSPFNIEKAISSWNHECVVTQRCRYIETANTHSATEHNESINSSKRVGLWNNLRFDSTSGKIITTPIRESDDGSDDESDDERFLDYMYDSTHNLKGYFEILGLDAKIVTHDTTSAVLDTNDEYIVIGKIVSSWEYAKYRPQPIPDLENVKTIVSNIFNRFNMSQFATEFLLHAVQDDCACCS